MSTLTSDPEQHPAPPVDYEADEGLDQAPPVHLLAGTSPWGIGQMPPVTEAAVMRRGEQ
jgi:hypothetical protein